MVCDLRSMGNSNKKKKKQKQVKNPTLPVELIVEILLRLPVRSLLRLKCVCKSWLSLISKPRFAVLHFDLAATPTHRILMNYNLGKKIESVDIKTSLGDDSALVKHVVPHPHNPPYDYYGLDVLGSCRGFILLSYKQGDIIVWNPSTCVHQRISNSHYALTVRFLYGFGYDPTTDDYLVVLLSLRLPEFGNHSEFFSFKTNTWYQIEDVAEPYMDIGYGYGRTGSYFNGALHWVVYTHDTFIYLIIAFDLAEKRLFEIPLPLDLLMVLEDKEYYMRIMGGDCLTLCAQHEETIEIWIMKEYQMQSSWIKSFILSVNGIPENLFSPRCFTKSGGFFGSNGLRRLVKLNDKGELLEHHPYGEEGDFLESDLWSVVYRESLLSLPAYFEEASEEDDQQ